MGFMRFMGYRQVNMAAFTIVSPSKNTDNPSNDSYTPTELRFLLGQANFNT